MNKDIIKGKGKQFEAAVKQEWGRLTSSDIKETNGDLLKLAGKIQETYGVAKNAAEKQVHEWAETITSK